METEIERYIQKKEIDSLLYGASCSSLIERKIHVLSYPVFKNYIIELITSSTIDKETALMLRKLLPEIERKISETFAKDISDITLITPTSDMGLIYEGGKRKISKLYSGDIETYFEHVRLSKALDYSVIRYLMGESICHNNLENRDVVYTLNAINCDGVPLFQDDTSMLFGFLESLNEQSKEANDRYFKKNSNRLIKSFRRQYGVVKK